MASRPPCWFCGVEQRTAGYQAYLALFDMNSEAEIERRLIGEPCADYRAVALVAVKALHAVNFGPLQQ